jgi:hypothetical protein
MTFDIKNPLLAELDTKLAEYDEALLTYEDSDFIVAQLVNEGTGVRWVLASQTPLYESLSDDTPVALTSNTPANIVTLTIPAGQKMLVTGTVVFKPTALTSTFVAAGCGITSATLPAVGQYMGMPWTGGAIRLAQAVPERFFDNSAGVDPVPVYLVANCVFSAGSVGASGWLRGRRVP